MANDPIIKAEHLTFCYPDEPAGHPPVLDDISLEIEAGSFVAILGHNGSGKSTFAKHINALLTPTAGKLWVDGLDTGDPENLLNIRGKVGMVFQNPDNQIVASVVEEDVAFGPENLGVPPAEIRQRVDQALKMVGMYDLREHSPHLLSGGQKQRVAIAGIIAMMPRCIVLDEATAMLDPVGRRETVETIRTLNEQYGITVLLITHHMDEAAQAQRLIVMAGGHIIDDGPPAQVFQHVDTLRSAGSGRAGDGRPALCAETRGVRRPPGRHQRRGLCTSLGGPAEKTAPFGRRVTPLEPIISLKQLTHIYSPNTPFEQRALDRIDLDIHPGEYLGIIGRTGSGKSTLIQHLNGLAKPTSGQVLFEGQDIWADKALTHSIRFQVGLVFQYPEYQLFEETVYRDIAFGPKNMKLDEAEIDRRVRRAAEFAGLKEDVLERSPFELSGGQKRRVAIAGVIAMEPKVLVLDEPTAGLDPAGAASILANIEAYRQANHATIVIVSHSMEDVARLADRLVVVSHGTLPYIGTPREVFSHGAALEELGLGVPAMNRVFSRVRAMGVDIDPAVYTVEQAKAAFLAAWRKRKEGK